MKLSRKNRVSSGLAATVGDKSLLKLGKVGKFTNVALIPAAVPLCTGMVTDGVSEPSTGRMGDVERLLHEGVRTVTAED